LRKTKCFNIAEESSWALNFDAVTGRRLWAKAQGAISRAECSNRRSAFCFLPSVQQHSIRAAPFRRQAVERMNACENVVGLAKELAVCRRVLYNWRDRMDETDPSPYTDPRTDLAQADQQAVPIDCAGRKNADAGRSI